MKVAKVQDENVKTKEQKYAKIKLNFVLTTYYKGTALEKLLKKLEEYMDNAPATENEVSSI